MFYGRRKNKLDDLDANFIFLLFYFSLLFPATTLVVGTSRKKKKVSQPETMSRVRLRCVCVFVCVRVCVRVCAPDT